jgi:hypothetical protein
MHGHEDRISCLQYDSMTKRIVSGDELGNIIIWKKFVIAMSSSTKQQLEEMPSNILATCQSRIVGLVLSQKGIDVAFKRGTMLSMDFLGSNSFQEG